MRKISSFAVAAAALVATGFGVWDLGHPWTCAPVDES
jgi:hypothetical protein